MHGAVQDRSRPTQEGCEVTTGRQEIFVAYAEWVAKNSLGTPSQSCWDLVVSGQGNDNSLSHILYTHAAWSLFTMHWPAIFAAALYGRE